MNARRSELIAAGVLLFVLTGCRSSPDLETSRKFQTAEKRYSSAETADDFQQAAALYQEILDQGFESGIVFYNLGNAWMQAGRPGRAIAAYRQAKRSLPRDPYLDANLRQALQQTGKKNETSLLDFVFFWQHTVSFGEKAAVTTVLLIVALILKLAAQLRIRPILCSRSATVALLLTSLVGVSVARDWWSFEWQKHGVITVAEATARKGASENYEPAFTQPLTEGTEFVVVSQQPDWLQIRIGGSGEVWVSKRECVAY